MSTRTSTARHRRTPRLPADIAARTWPSAVAALSAAGVVAWLAFRSGGYFPTAYLPAGAVAAALCGVVLALRPPLYMISTHALVGIGALAALTAWTALSTAWSPDPNAGLEDVQRDMAYLAVFGLGLLAAGSGRLARGVVWLLGALALAIVLAGLADRLLPGAAEQVGALGYRLDGPLTYWNAYGALAALTAVLAVGLAADPRAHPAARGAAAAAGVLAAVGMYLSLSRGAWMALAAGLVVLVAVRPRWRLAATLAVVGTAVTVALVRLRAFPALVEDPAAGAGQVDAAHAFLPELLALTVAAGAVQAVGAALAGAHGWRWRPVRRAAGRLAGPAAGACVIAALAGYVAAADRIEGGVVDAGDHVQRQWDDFLRPAATSATGTARLTTTQGTRSDVYRVALEGWRDHPLAGEGAGAFRVRWARDRDVGEYLVNAHSLPLETLGDTGVIGLALLAAFLASLGLAAARSIRRPGALTAAEAAAVTAACAVWAAHSAVDWDWQVPALTGLVLVLAATLYPYGRRTRRAQPPAPAPDATRETPWSTPPAGAIP